MIKVLGKLIHTGRQQKNHGETYDYQKKLSFTHKLRLQQTKQKQQRQDDEKISKEIDNTPRR